MVKVTYQPKVKYSNPLARELGLLHDDIKREGKLQRLLADLEGLTRRPVAMTATWHVQQAEQTGPLPLPKEWRNWPKLTDRTVWGETQKHTWLVAEVEVPAEAQDQTLVMDVGTNWRPMQGSTDPQCLVYLDGEISQALDGNHTELVLSQKAKQGARHLVQINAFTFDERPMVGLETTFFVRNQRADVLFHRLSTSFEVAIRLQQGDGRRHRLLDLIDRSLAALDRRLPLGENFDTTLNAAEEIAAEIHEVSPDGARPTISAFGHTHLDVAWLWRVKHVRDKTARSFATALGLMDEFPDFVFMYNQSILFDYLKNDYPALWDRVRSKVKSGQFEVEGAMWVEPDVNLASGEALVRQIMRGRQFLIDEFGVTPRSVWLPDTFGYSAALPQILTKSGLDFFVTSKLSWNDTDRHPYDSFFWRGIDGSKIKAQLITTQSYEASDHRTVYNSAFSVSDVLGTWSRYEPKALNSDVMICFGHGDGGGGPTREMVQRGLALRDGIPGAPNVKLEGLRPFLERLGSTMEARAVDFPTWDGELYLQYHRGTLTSVAKNKAHNRNAERHMRELEFLASMAQLLRGAPYPSDDIQRLWDIVLLNQFHDILPGTSIAEVYADTDVNYASFFEEMERPDGPLLSAISTIVSPAGEGAVTLLNTIAQKRQRELIRLPILIEDAGHSFVTKSGESPLQLIQNADGTKETAARVSDVPSLGWAHARIETGMDQTGSDLIVAENHLENSKLSIRFDANGEISSIIKKSNGRELIPQGARANRLMCFEDKPKNYDAWDIDDSFEDISWPLNKAASIKVVETGPLRSAVRIERAFGQSKIVQVISLEEHASQIEFDTYVDWQERQILLKTAFPMDLNVSETRAEIQFGHVKRPSHRNTSWDQARFETSMHRWVDMSEPDFGAALLNDCKYGYDAKDQTIRLTLLKSPVVPDPEADLGFHRFRYALRLHEGEKDLSDVVRAAERFNNPIRVHGTLKVSTDKKSEFPDPYSFVRIDQGSVTLETVKHSENGDGYILRLFEHANRRCSIDLDFAQLLESVDETNLMEFGSRKIPLEDPQKVSLSFRPFEVKTLRIRFLNPPQRQI